MSDFLRFRKMITPVVIQIIFWILVVISIIAGLAMIVMGVNDRYGGGGLVLLGVLYIFLGPLFVRIYCEVLIVIFRILDSLRNIERNTQPTSAGQPQGDL